MNQGESNKVKIALITRHAISNYGSLLQTIATQKIIKRLGHECEVIDYIRKDEDYRNIARLLLERNDRWNSCLFRRLIYLAVQSPEYYLMGRKFEQMRKKYLHLSRRYETLKELKEYPPEADIYMTGSDQVWGPIGEEAFDASYFLDFVPEHAKAVAYAASFGRTELKKNHLDMIREYLEKYSYLTVRENSAVTILKEMGITGMHQVLDPTLLISAEEWSRLIPAGVKLPEHYVLIYQLHSNRAMDRYAKRFAKKVSLPLIRISPTFHQVIRSGKVKLLPDVGKFLAYIKNADYMITDSFHGLVFAINFNTQFVNIAPGKSKTRNQSILELTGLTDRTLGSMDDFSFINRRIDYEPVNQRIKKARAESVKQLKQMLGNQMEKKKSVVLFADRKNCCGCGACVNACPGKAIRLQEDSYGFLYPHIDQEICTGCGKCRRVCAYQKEERKLLQASAAYVSAAKKDRLLIKSASGGIFAVAAEKVLSSGGAVFGAVLDCSGNTLVPHHVMIEDRKQLSRLQGSKYVQSDTEDTYHRAKIQLDSGRMVLYSGTPCQIAGLKGYLGKNYENLITMDIICHGVPSARMFQDYIKLLMKKWNGTVKDFKFRDKSKGWGHNAMIIYEDKKGRTHKKWIPSGASSYFDLFLKSENFRENCYSCPYASRHRIGDLTVGDYWGIQKEHPELLEEAGGNYSDRKGISCILINTEKGKRFLQQMEDRIWLDESSVEKVAKGNVQLNHPGHYTEKREKILDLYAQKGYEAVDDYFKRNNRIRIGYSYIKSMIPRSLKKEIKRCLGNWMKDGN